MVLLLPGKESIKTLRLYLLADQSSARHAQACVASPVQWTLAAGQFAEGAPHETAFGRAFSME
jgi:hypothetical protein